MRKDYDRDIGLKGIAEEERAGSRCTQVSANEVDVVDCLGTRQLYPTRPAWSARMQRETRQTELKRFRSTLHGGEIGGNRKDPLTHRTSAKARPGAVHLLY